MTPTPRPSLLVATVCAVTALTFPATLDAQKRTKKRGQQARVEPAKIGEVVPDFEFQKPIGHKGLTHLADFFGQPVLVAGWRTHLVDGMHAGRVAFQLHQKYGKEGLVIIMTDRQTWTHKTSRDGSATFWLQTSQMLPYLTSIPGLSGNKKLKGTDLPIEWTVPRDTRSAALIGVDGKLLALGTVEKIRDKEKRTDYRAKLRKLVAAELKRRKNGWGTDPIAVQARALAFGKGQLAAAMALLEENSATDQVPERKAAMAEIERHLESRLKSLRFFLDEGEIATAKDLQKTLAAAVKGRKAFEDRLAEAGSFLTTKEGKAELSLSKKLEKIVRPIVGNPPKGKATVKMLANLRKFAARHEGKRVATRAKNLDYIISSIVAYYLGLKTDQLEKKVAKMMKK